MGWEIHITRADHWAEGEDNPIRPDEWLSVVEADPELTIDPRDNGPHFALWLSHSVESDHPWFDWFQGVVSTKHPDRATLGKALQIAKRLGARVQGDDGEEYTSPEQLQE